MGGSRLLLSCLLAGVAVGLGTATGLALATPPAAPVRAEPGHLPVALPASGGRDDCEAAPLEERAGQVLIVGLPGVTAGDDPLVDEVVDVGVGGVLLTDTNVQAQGQVRALVRALRRASGRPLLVTTDEEPGRVSSFGALLGRTSSARTLAARGEPDDMRELARDLGEELAALGVDVDLAPVVDVDGGPARGIIGDRAFSGDPDTVTEYGLAFAEGLAAAGVHPTAKHFPGHGLSDVDSHLRLGSVDAPLRVLLEEEIPPFAALIEAGVPLVMVNHVAYDALDPNLPASLAAPTYELLRDQGFEGVAITDSVGMGAVHQHWDFDHSVVMAIAAGADAVLVTDGTFSRAMRDALVSAVRSGELDEDRLNEAAGRMLALKGEDAESVVCQPVAPAPVLRPSSHGPHAVPGGIERS